MKREDNSDIGRSTSVLPYQVNAAHCNLKQHRFNRSCTAFNLVRPVPGCAHSVVDGAITSAGSVARSIPMSTLSGCQQSTEKSNFRQPDAYLKTLLADFG
jgi:hypothetical protein